MKIHNTYRSALLLVLMVWPFCTIYPQWVQKNSGTTKALRDIVFLDNNHGWAVGDSGAVLKTGDGGESWHIDSSFANNIKFKEITFFTKDSGVIGGNIVTQHPFFQTHRAVVYRTNNGGLSWIVCYTPADTNATFQDLCFVNSATGYIGTNNIGNISSNDREGALYKTTDGGVTWKSIKNTPDVMIGTVEILPGGTGYAFWSLGYDNSDDTKVEATTDGGSTWDIVGTIPKDVIKKAFLIDRDTIWTIGQAISFSGDAGKTWKQWSLSNPIVSGEKRFYAADIDVAKSGRILLFGSAFSSASDGEGRVVESVDMGLHWKTIFQRSGDFFTAAHINGAHGWLAGINGMLLYSDNVLLEAGRSHTATARQFALHQNYPNPFNPTTAIAFELPSAGMVTLTVYDVLGREVRSLVNEYRSAGYHRVSFDASGLSSGLYFYRLHSAGFSGTKKMMLIR